MTEYNERVAKVAMDIIDTIKDRLAAHEVTHQEYRQAWAWLIGLANSGEVPLFLDAHFEAAVERITYRGKPGSEGTVQGPYHSDNHPRLVLPYKMPMRDDEAGDPFLFSGQITDLAGSPLDGVIVDAWQAGNDGTYSNFNPAVPENNLRGIMETDINGEFTFASIRPAPYPIPASGPTGEFMEMTGRHVWRPAHFHFILSKDGFEPLITQICFKGDRIIEGDGDCVDGVKDSLIIEVGEDSDAEVSTTYGLASPYQTGRYVWQLRPSS